MTKADKSPSEIALEAVRAFAKEREQLRAIHARHRGAIDAFLHQSKHCQDAAARAKLLVASAGQTIGEFKLTPRSSTPNYDGEAVIGLLGQLALESKAKFGALAHQIWSAQLVSKLSIDPKAARLVHESRQSLAKSLENVWQDSVVLTPAVSVPEF